MVKYLITGGCGFIGSHLAHTLCHLGFSVRILDNLSTGKKENAPQGAELIIGDVRDRKILKEVTKGISGCFHLAAIASMEKSILELAETHTVNVGGLLNLIEALVENGPVPVIYTSSAAVYGNSVEMPLKESSEVFPLSPYGVDKWSGEKHLAVAWHLHGIPSTSFRLFNVYGPGQDPHSPYSGVISIFAKNIAHGKKITIYGDGLQQRDFVYVEDVVKFLILAMEKKNHGSLLFNIATGRAMTILELALLLEKMTKKEVPKEFALERKGDIRASLGSPSALESYFGLHAKTRLEEGLIKCVEL
jgi:UDP-glucose 4-epimerase